MVGATWALFHGKPRIRVLFQVAMFGTAFAAFRLLESPSTQTFSIFESALAATTGIFLRGRAAESDRTPDDIGNPRAPGVAEGGVPDRGPLRTQPITQTMPWLMNGRDASTRAYLVLSSVFFVLIAIALWILSEGLYVAPAAFYVFIAGSAGAAALNAYWSGNRRPVGVLVQIMMLAALLKFHFFYLNPYVYTSDGFLHFKGTEVIASSGHVPQTLGHYFFFPAYHVFGFVGVSIGGLPASWHGATTFLAQLTTIAIAYLIGREIANPRVGLFAAILTVFSLFFFLSVTPVPSLFGLPFLFLSIYALVRVQKRGGRGWYAVFWISALGTLFSHPINALVLLLALLLRFVQFYLVRQRTGESRGPMIPFLSYGVVYAAYLSFIAIVSFEDIVRAFVPSADGLAPALATAPGAALQTSGSYLLMSAVAPSGFAFLFFFAAYGMLSSRGISPLERQYIVMLGLAFLLLPALEFVTENYRTQSSRFLLYITIPLVLIGAHGAESLTRGHRGTRRATNTVLILFVVFSFVSASSYLTSNDGRDLYSSVPVMPIHITESALSSREFVASAADGSRVYMDFGSWLYFDNNARARNALKGFDVDLIDGFAGRPGPAFVMVNDEFLAYGNPYVGRLYDAKSLRASLEDAQASRIFDAGVVQVYLVP